MLDDPDLDDLLRALPAEQPSAALRERVLAAAPSSRFQAGRRFWWTLGAGWAAAGVAGLVLGATLPSPAAPAGSELDQAFAAEEGLWPEDVG